MTLLNGNGIRVSLGGVIQTVTAVIVGAAIVGIYSDVGDMKVQMATVVQATKDMDRRIAIIETPYGATAPAAGSFR